MPILSIERRHLAPTPVLFVRSQVTRQQIAAVIGESLGKVAAYAGRSAIALAGMPFARYPAMGAETLTMEVGFPTATPAAGEGEVLAGTLPGGDAAVAVHGGSYDTLHESYRALEGWGREHGVTMASAPWEVYVTDPETLPDTNDWRTEIFWPIDA